MAGKLHSKMASVPMNWKGSCNVTSMLVLIPELDNPIFYYFCRRIAVVAQMVEHQLPKLRVVGSIPIYRSGLWFLSMNNGC